MSDNAVRTRSSPWKTRGGTGRAGGAVGAILVGLGLMHFVLDGLVNLLVPLQPLLATRTGASPTALSGLVAAAVAAASLLQPLSARFAIRYGERPATVLGAVLASAGYGALPAVETVAQSLAVVAVGGLGSSLFHPAAGALMARVAEPGRESLPLAAFSAVGTAGAAILPVSMLMSVGALGWAAAFPAAATLVALSLAVRARALHGGASSPLRHRVTTASDRRRIRLAVAAGSMIALAGTTVAASAAVLVAALAGPSNPAVPWALAAYSSSAAAGGMGLALAARRFGARVVLLFAVAGGTIAAALVPLLPLTGVFVAIAVAGAGLPGSLPLLVSHARRPDEGSAAGAVGRVLGLAAGLGGVAYAGVGVLQSAVGYGAALVATVTVAGMAALVVGWFLCGSVDPGECADLLRSAVTSCSGGSCAC